MAKKSGLDIDLGNTCSKDAYDWAKRTFINRKGKLGEIAMRVDGAFSNLLQFGDMRIGISSDGIGTKIELAERTNIYDSLGYDLVAMVADDLATAGFEPVSISNIIDVDILDREVINALMRGLADASDFCGIHISGGEIAELGNRIQGYGSGMHFNWCSTAIGVLPQKLNAPLDGSDIAVGDKVLSIQSEGFRSNGFSLLRRIMEEHFGSEWHNAPYQNGDRTWGQMLLHPSLICSPLICASIEAGLQLKGAAHITGGGILENFRRILKAQKGLGAVLDSLFAPLPIMQELIELGNIPLADAYTYWNMGNAMLLVLADESVEAFLSLAQEKGYTAQVAGHICQGEEIELRRPDFQASLRVFPQD